MSGDQFDVAVVGGGIVGLAVARELLHRRPGLRLVLLEREHAVAQHQTARNSGVIHAGIYYAPGSLKARLSVEGAAALYAYCEQRGIAHERCGKVVVATEPDELGRLDELERRARANGVPDLRRLAPEELREVEPHCRGLAALHSPHTGIVDFAAVARALAEDVEAAGGVVRLGCEVRAPADVPAPRAVFCAGLGASRLATRAGAPADPRIVPFRGQYLELAPRARHLVRGLIYPVPDPELPFLGVHLTRHVDGRVLLGPTATLAGGLTWPGTWRMARRWWRTGVAELRTLASRRAFVAACRRFVPEVDAADVRRSFAGVRAQAVGRDGRLVDDFVLSEAGATLHVRNAPSPAATSSLALARLVADRVERTLRGC